MKVDDFGGSHRVGNLTELQQVLSARFDAANEFILAHDDDQFPYLSILIKGGSAALYYVPRDGEAGYASIGGKLGLNPKETTSFAIGQGADSIQVSNRAIIPVSVALAAADDFFRFAELPRCVEWLKL